MKGNSWRIVSINDDDKTMYVEPMFRDLSTIPYWVGELIPVECETAQIVGEMRRDLAINPDSKIQVSAQQKSRIKRIAEELSGVPDDKTIVIERKKASSTVVVHSCLGTKINQTLATLLSTLLSAKIGYLVDTKSDSYRIVLSTSGPLDGKVVQNALKEEVVIEEILQASIVGTHPLNWKTWYVGKKFGVVAKSAEYDRRAARLIQERFRGTALYNEILRELFQEKYDIEATKKVMSDLRCRKTSNEDRRSG